MHSEMTTTIDLNGAGEWSLDGIRHRYARYAEDLGVSLPRQLEPLRAAQGARQWIYPVLEQVLVGLKEGDPACVAIAVDLVCSDERFTFGKIFKDKAARGLRDAELADEQVGRIRQHAIYQLEKGFVGPEFRTLAQLVRRIGLGELRERVLRVKPVGPRVANYVRYFGSLET